MHRRSIMKTANSLNLVQNKPLDRFPLERGVVHDARLSPDDAELLAMLFDASRRNVPEGEGEEWHKSNLYSRGAIGIFHTCVGFCNGMGFDWGYCGFSRYWKDTGETEDDLIIQLFLEQSLERWEEGIGVPEPGAPIRIELGEFYNIPKLIELAVKTYLLHGIAPDRGSDKALRAFYAAGGPVDPIDPKHIKAVRVALQRTSDLADFFNNDLFAALL